MNDLRRMLERISGASMRPPRRLVWLNEEIKHTENLFGTTEELKAAEPLELFEQSGGGDCLCLVKKEYLVSIDHQDIKRIV